MIVYIIVDDTYSGGTDKRIKGLYFNLRHAEEYKKDYDTNKEWRIIKKEIK